MIISFDTARKVGQLSGILTFAGTVHGFFKNCHMLFLSRHEVSDVHL